MKNLSFAFLLLISLSAASQSADETAIRTILSTQTKAWNRGDLEGFMKGYWQNDSLLFIGKSGVTRGWRQTLENYKKGYPDTAAMGQLRFDLVKVEKLSAEYYFVVGKWMLKRTAGDLGGHYTLLFRKLKGQWVIVADHSS